MSMQPMPPLITDSSGLMLFMTPLTADSDASLLLLPLVIADSDASEADSDEEPGQRVVGEVGGSGCSRAENVSTFYKI